MTMGRRSGAGSGRRVETVLVPLDGSKLAEGALAHVVRLLGGSKLRLVLLQVVPSVNPAPLVAVSVPAPLHASAARRARGERHLEGWRPVGAVRRRPRSSTLPSPCASGSRWLRPRDLRRCAPAGPESAGWSGPPRGDPRCRRLLSPPSKRTDPSPSARHSARAPARVVPQTSRATEPRRAPAVDGGRDHADGWTIRVRSRGGCGLPGDAGQRGEDPSEPRSGRLRGRSG